MVSQVGKLASLSLKQDKVNKSKIGVNNLMLLTTERVSSISKPTDSPSTMAVCLYFVSVIWQEHIIRRRKIK